MNNNDYTLKLLNIQDEDIKFIKIELINNNYVIELEQTRSATTSCPNCGGMEYTLNSIYTRTIKRFLYRLPTALLKALLLIWKYFDISSGVEALPRGNTPPILSK